jgi:3-hydroxyisobutyrate dehydrogenase-like beta-hydroxyacid dehydrogenase
MATGLKLYPVYVYNTTPESDSEEYNDEATMVESNLESIRRAADCIDQMINDKDNVAEWAQEKIAVTKSMLNSVCDYLKSKQLAKKA